MPSFPPVSVIVPVRDAANIISAALDSVLAQDYAGPVETIVADGSDGPATSEVVRRRFPEARLVANPKRTRPNGINAGLAVATGRFVVLCDCHTLLPPDYVRHAIETLTKTGAGVVGGRQRPVGSTLFERAVGMAITTPMGAGDARYRLGMSEGPVDNIYLGVFRRDTLEAVGEFDPELFKGADVDFNWRLRRSGKTVWFDPGLTVFYRPRGSIRALARQYFEYGRWKPAVLRRYPTETRARHLAAPLIVAGLAGSALLAAAGASGAAGVLPACYAAALVAGAVVTGVRRRDTAAVLLPVVLATMHVSWGTGFFCPPVHVLRRPFRRATVNRETGS